MKAKLDSTHGNRTISKSSTSSTGTVPMRKQRAIEPCLLRQELKQLHSFFSNSSASTYNKFAWRFNDVIAENVRLRFSSGKQIGVVTALAQLPTTTKKKETGERNKSTLQHKIKSFHNIWREKRMLKKKHPPGQTCIIKFMSFLHDESALAAETNPARTKRLRSQSVNWK